MQSKILPIVLIYHEAGQTEATEAALRAAGFTEWYYADRDGVGSMARAFNAAVTMLEHDYQKPIPEYLWFVTNVTFPPDLPASLLDALESRPDAAAVHPAMDSSHGFINKAVNVGGCHFIEWTAPLVRYEAWQEIGQLDENMPYVHFDLDWSHRAKLEDWKLLVDGRHRVDHIYLHINQPERISQIRNDLRALRHEKSLQALIDKWGNNWKKTLCQGGNCG